MNCSDRHQKECEHRWEVAKTFSSMVCPDAHLVLRYKCSCCQIIVDKTIPDAPDLELEIHNPHHRWGGRTLRQKGKK